MCQCIHCVHARLSLRQGAVACECSEAHEALGEEKIEEYLKGGEHD